MSLWSIVHGVWDNTTKTSSGAARLVSSASLVTVLTHADNAHGLQSSEITYISFVLLVVKQRSEAWAAKHRFRLVNRSNLGLDNLLRIKPFVFLLVRATEGTFTLARLDSVWHSLWLLTRACNTLASVPF